MLSTQKLLKKRQGKSDYDVSEVKDRTAITLACTRFREYVHPFIDLVRDTNDISKYRILYNLSQKLIEYEGRARCCRELRSHFALFKVSPEGAVVLGK